MRSEALSHCRALRCLPVLGLVLLSGAPAVFGQQTRPAVAATQPAEAPATVTSGVQPLAGQVPVSSAAAGPRAEHETGAAHTAEGEHGIRRESAQHAAPSLLAVAPFVGLLLCIAILPLIHSVEHWWHHNRNKFLVAAALATITLAYYLLRGTGFGHGAEMAPKGLPTVARVLQYAVLDEYLPFIILLFCLYTISGGIQLRGDLQATPGTNTVFLGLGALLASFIGTTGASMLLIRPLLQTNHERRRVRHTVIFFIFLVSNIGGCLLPTGDPPLFLGYLFGVPFLWTLNLWKEWAVACILLLVIYWVWDTAEYREEGLEDRRLDAEHREPLRIAGSLNFLWLLLVVAAVAVLVPGQRLPGTSIELPRQIRVPGTSAEIPNYLREAAMLAVVLIAYVSTPSRIRKGNSFDFTAITEVAVLFIGIFITMQAPIEILNIRGPELGLEKPWQFFWAAGGLSSFLDNAPTYVVYFKTAGTLVPAGMPLMGDVDTVLKTVPIPLLTAISLGAVFMGANTYIGNGPNFMVKSIAEQSGVKMPSFFGYMLYSIGILIPLFLLIMGIFLI